MPTKTTNRTTIRAVIQEHTNEAARLSSLLRIYPDLTSGVSSKKRRFLSSKVINARATDFEIVASCTCCPDPELFLKIWVDTKHGRVHGVPYQIKIGQREDGLDYPDEGWDEALANRGVRPLIIDKLKAHFTQQPEESEEG